MKCFKPHTDSLYRNLQLYLNLTLLFSFPCLSRDPPTSAMLVGETPTWVFSPRRRLMWLISPSLVTLEIPIYIIVRKQLITSGFISLCEQRVLKREAPLQLDFKIWKTVLPLFDFNSRESDCVCHCPRRERTLVPSGHIAPGSKHSLFRCSLRHTVFPDPRTRRTQLEEPLRQKHFWRFSRQSRINCVTSEMVAASCGGSLRTGPP